MNERSQAIELLKRAREILLRRLAERVAETGDDLLDDALGLTYAGEIETIYEQIGGRLQNVSTMLSHLQSAEEEAPAPAADTLPLTEGLFEDEVAFAAEPTVEMTYDLQNFDLALDEAQPATFETFAQQVQAGQLDRAARSLAALFELDEARARRCAHTFQERVASSPEWLDKALRLRHELQAGAVNNSLMLLWECFGLQGAESVGVMHSLRNRLQSQPY